MESYFQAIYKDVLQAYDVANKARAKGFDPEDQVEIPLARNMSERVVGLVTVVAPMIKDAGPQIVERIKILEDTYGVQDWRVALTISTEVADQKFCTFATKEQGMEVGIRIGIAYVTNGVVSSPLEGFVKLEVRKRKDQGNYVALFFSGPIRSAGGTGASLSVLIGDYVRKHLGYGVYDPTEDEVKRMITELYDYHDKVTNLQYLPSEEEIRMMVSNLAVQIEGDPSEKYDVSNYKGLDRVNTDKIRNGPCLVIGEGLCQKSAKLHGQLAKWGKTFGLEQWGFLEQFLQLQKEIKAKLGAGKLSTDGAKIKPDFTYIKDIVAGRPVLAHPLASGGLRIRYGRGRTSGFSADSIHPATMAVLRSYIAIGTQFKVERPGKSTVVSSCDSLEGPIVKLISGDVVFLETFEDAKKVAKDVVEIIYMGDVLINYGDFFNRKSLLVPPGYCEEWWVQELEAALQTKQSTSPPERLQKLREDFFYTKPTAKEAVQLSLETGVPLHPRYTYHWLTITKEQLELLEHRLQKASKQEEKIVLPLTEDDIKDTGVKRVLELLGVPHKYVAKEYLVIEGDWAYALQKSLEGVHFDGATTLQMLNPQLIFRDKDGTALGCRMGRPEKAKMRKLTGSPQVLFPVGKEGGRMRCFSSALDKQKITAEFPLLHCLTCQKDTIYRSCETCHTKTQQRYSCPQCGITQKYPCHDRTTSYKEQPLDIGHYFAVALKQSGMSSPPELIKGVKGTSNKNHTPEHLVKGILRAKHGVYVNKDGTIRYDMTEMPLTHFKPKEIGTSIKQLHNLGYLKDIKGEDLVSDDQILEIKPQDIILPHSEESLEEGAQDVLFKIANFVDDLLFHLYGLDPYYKLKTKADLIGHLVVGLAPHISAGMVARIIGFSKTQGFLAHPSYHSALRRDCDGDEACILLLTDMLLNFSRHYLPTHRGSTQDAPLVLSSKLIPKEIDDMVYDLDVAWTYPLALYQNALEYKEPNSVKIPKMGDYLGTPRQYEGFGYTHPTQDLNYGVLCSAYKSLPTMVEKVHGQMELAEKIRAVDQTDVARLVIERHFIRDLKGNLRKFSSQQFRCVDCNMKFRRPPLIGNCFKCGGKILFTISEGSIVKYLEISLKLAEKYNVSSYLKQNLELTKMRIESIFGREVDKQEGLVKWFG